MIVCAMTSNRGRGQFVNDKDKREESVSERGKGGLLSRHLFALEVAAGICSEAGFVAVAKEMLLAFVAIAEREAGLLA